MLQRIAGRIGRRYWLKRIDGALSGAYRAGLIDSWVLHAIDAKAKYHPDPYSNYDRKPPGSSTGRGGEP
jgi:hypothetical protein